MKKSIILTCSMLAGFLCPVWASVTKTNKLEWRELVVKPILWQLVNTVDGSKHLMLGTTHRMNVSLRYFPLEVQAAVRGADTLIGELLPSQKDDSSLDVVNTASIGRLSSPLFTYHRKQEGDPDLDEQLGEKHWRLLQGIIKDRREDFFTKVLSMGLKRQEAQTVISVIHAIARQEAYHGEYPTLDAQIASSGLAAGKQLVGLETLAELEQHVMQYRAAATEHLRDLDSNGDMLVEILKDIIDSGGINYLRDKFLEARTNYLEGNVIKALAQLNPFILDPYFDEIMIDQRNLAWIEEGKIQEHCWTDNKCFIYIGFAHLFKVKHPLIKLLRAQGFDVTAIEPTKLEQDSHSHNELVAAD